MTDERKSTCINPGMRVCYVSIFAALIFFAFVFLPKADAAASPSLSIVKVLPFAGANNVRIETTLSDASPGAVNLTGKIAVWPQGATLWEGPVGHADLSAGQSVTVTQQVSGLKPLLWDLQACHLYSLTITASGPQTPPLSQTVRFGFRSFTTKNGQFLLNGRQLFLRGNAVNPPGRGTAASVQNDPVFARAYIRELKSRNINIIRTGDDQVWLDACDELGMLVFSGRYGAAPGGSRTAPPQDFDASIAAYKSQHFERYLLHPSVVIDILTNEMPRIKSYNAFLSQAYHVLREWDPNRLFIANAGFGRGLTGDINDLHPYAGWYNKDFLAYYGNRRAPKKIQPQTFTETVAAYTGADGRFTIESKQLPATLTWIGHTPEPREDSLAYQAFLTKQIIESMRCMRVSNPQLAGVMPFTGIFYHYDGVTKVSQMGAKPVADQMRISYQPVLLSWEMWTPQVYAGTQVHAVAHIVNDALDGSDLTGTSLAYALESKSGAVYLHGTSPLPHVPYYAAKSQSLSFTLPATLPGGDYSLRGSVMKNGVSVSTNTIDIYVAPRSSIHSSTGRAAAIAVYDPSGKTARALQRLGIPIKLVSRVSAVPPGAALVIGEDTWDPALAKQKSALKEMVRKGGHVLLLRQNAVVIAQNVDWLGAGLRFAPGTADTHGMYINPERPEHPIFQGVPRQLLHFWSDPTDWNEAKPGLPAIYPVGMSFEVASQADLAHTAILCDFGRGLAEIALGEVFDGKGSVLISGFDLTAHSGLDPAADRLLRNLVAYTTTSSGHYAQPFINTPIVWGDYRTERGLISGPQCGLLDNVGEAKSPQSCSARPLFVGHGRAWAARVWSLQLQWKLPYCG